jgi:hypothetical protein
MDSCGLEKTPVISLLKGSNETTVPFFNYFFLDSPQWARVSLFTRFLDHTHLRTTVGRTSLDE